MDTSQNKKILLIIFLFIVLYFIVKYNKIIYEKFYEGETQDEILINRIKINYIPNIESTFITFVKSEMEKITKDNIGQVLEDIATDYGNIQNFKKSFEDYININEDITNSADILIDSTISDLIETEYKNKLDLKIQNILFFLSPLFKAKDMTPDDFEQLKKEKFEKLAPVVSLTTVVSSNSEESSTTVESSTSVATSNLLQEEKTCLENKLNAKNSFKEELYQLRNQRDKMVDSNNKIKIINKLISKYQEDLKFNKYWEKTLYYYTFYLHLTLVIIIFVGILYKLI